MINRFKKIPIYAKVLMATILPGFAVLTVAFVVLALHDAPPPDDSEYKVPFVPVSDANNAAEMLSKLIGKVKTSRTELPELYNHLSYWQWDDFWKGDLVDFELQAFVMTQNREALGILSSALKKPDMQFGFDLIGAASLPGPPPDAESFLHVCKVARISWQNTKDGKRIFAWDEALAHIQLAKRYGTAENATLVCMMVGMAAEREAISLLLNNISHLNEPDKAMQIASWLNDGAYKTTDFKHILKTGYLFLDALVCNQEAILKRNPTLRMRYMSKPNETRQRALAISKSMQDAIDRGDDRFEIPPKEFFSDSSKLGMIIFTIKPNAIGRIMLEMSYSGNWDAIYGRVKHDMARAPLAACAFALRAYWLDHEKLPESLDELAPGYIKSVPVDVYGGKPVQYNRELAVVYSAGKARVYDDGAFALGPGARYDEKRPSLILDWAESRGSMQ